MLVDVGLFLDVDVIGGYIGFGLIVVIVTNKVLDRIFWEEVLKLGV